MEREDDIDNELNEIAPGFPGRTPMEPPAGYFDTFPGRILNQWQKEKSQPVLKMITWRKVAAIAALVAGVSFGMLKIFSGHHPQPTQEITALEAYQYINEHIDEFEPLIESGEIAIPESGIDVPKDAIEEYLMEEIHGSNPEELF